MPPVSTAEGELPRTRLSERLDAGVRRIGEWISWVWVLLLATIVTNVVMRYTFGSGRIEFEELQWHLYSLGFLTGLAYCVPSDSHVRVDFAHERMSPRHRAWVELYGLLFLFAPFVALVLVYGAPFVATSFAQSEVSSSPGGLPARWLVKGTLLFGFGLLAVAGFARFLRVCSALFGVPRAVPHAPSDRHEAPGGPPTAGRPGAS